MLSASLLTGCDVEESKEVFGATGSYVLKLGRDIFRAGETGVFGGATVTDPQSNENSEIFHNYNVVEVTKAPKEEKKAYDFSGPVNSGLTMTGEPETQTTPVASPDPGTSTGSQTAGGPVIVLTPGHTGSTVTGYEPFAPSSYAVAAKALVFWFEKGRGSQSASFVIRYKPSEAFKCNGQNVGTQGEVAAAICAQKEEPTKNELIHRLIACGIIKPIGTKKKKAGEAYDDDQEFSYTFVKGHSFNYYSWWKTKKGKKFEKTILTQLNAKKSNGNWKYPILQKWAKTMEASGSDEVYSEQFSGRGLKVFKLRATGGASYDSAGIGENVFNFQIAKALAARLRKDGYDVVLTRSSATENKVGDLDYTNRNIALYGNSVPGAVVHFGIHCDSSDGSNIGMFVIGSPSPITAKAHENGDDIRNAMYEKAKKGVKVYNSWDSVATKNNKKTMIGENTWGEKKAYTTLNWQTIPTMYIECACLNDADMGRYVCAKNSKQKFYADKWLEGRYDIFKAGVEKAVELAGSANVQAN